MIKEIELKYTVQMLAEMARRIWGENSTEFLAGALHSVVSEKQFIALIDKLEQDIQEKEEGY